MIFLILFHINRASTDDLGTSESIVKVPVLFIMGNKDYTLKFPGIEDYINSGKLNEFVPDLEIVFLPEGTHFVQEQSPDQINELILTFLRKYV